MQERELDLINRGYDKNLVESLCNYTLDDVNNISLKIFREISYGCSPISKPKCIFVGGQPGSGKSTRIDEITNHFSNNIIVINMDLYRDYHPKYKWIIEAINNHWKDRIVTDDDSPGNDLADFTHQFAGAVSDKLGKLATEVINGEAYNVAIEWGMREPYAPLDTIEEMHNKGYYCEVIFIAVHKDESLESCNYRDLSKEELVRRVSKSFHERCIQELPISAKTIYEEGMKRNIIDSFKIVDRNNNVIWNKNSNEDIYELYYQYLNRNKYEK